LNALQDLNAKLDRAAHLISESRDREAVATLAPVIEAVPQNGHAQLMMAQALTGCGREDDAFPHLLAATNDSNSAGMALGMLGYWHQSRGQFEEARSRFVQSIAVHPNQSLAYYGWSQSNRTTLDQRSVLDQAQSIIDRPELAPEDRMILHYVLGKGYADLSDYESSIKHYDLANDLAFEQSLQGRPFDRSKYSQTIDGTLATFNKQFFLRLRGTGSNSRKPIFVVGMMRSGTTLVEQILSSHPSVTGAGELDFWLDHGPRCFDLVKRDVDFKRVVQAASMYLQVLDDSGNGAERVVDKMPQNFQMVGLIHTAFPKAPIIHVRRNPIDTCLSIYTNAYQESPAFAHQRSSIVFAYRQYQRMVAHWRAVIPANRFLEVDYEELVTNPEPQIRKILAFSGLPFDEACLRPEDNQRVVTTPSLWQVRQPVYRSSVERWKVYEPWLGEFAELKLS